MLSLPCLRRRHLPKARLLSTSCAENFGKTSAQLNLGSGLRLLNGRGLMMLRVETQRLDGALICRLEGRFTGEGAEEVRRLVTRCDSELEFVVDLTDVMFIDAIGEQVLLFVKRLGAQFVAETSYSRDVCERLGLPFSQRKSNLQVPSNSDENGHRPRR
jgi:hypothetical protein